MIGLLQRVSSASVMIAGEPIASIGAGLLLFIGVEQHDNEVTANRLLDRLLGYRVFPDDQGKMNRSVRDIGGGVLFVPQFTLTADTGKGKRASFTSAADPVEGRRLYEYLVQRAKAEHTPVASGLFGAEMQVSLINTGPVTFWLQVPPGRPTNHGQFDRV